MAIGASGPATLEAIVAGAPRADGPLRRPVSAERVLANHVLLEAVMLLDELNLSEASEAIEQLRSRRYPLPEGLK